MLRLYFKKKFISEPPDMFLGTDISGLEKLATTRHEGKFKNRKSLLRFFGREKVVAIDKLIGGRVIAAMGEND